MSQIASAQGGEDVRLADMPAAVEPLAAAKQVRTIQSVDRALSILEVLAAATGEMPLGEIAERAGLNPSTCHHLLGTLVVRGYVGQTPSTRSYFLGARITQLAQFLSSAIAHFRVGVPQVGDVIFDHGDNP